LLQANFVLWVEGPSDRVYLNRWLLLSAPDLVEGIDYSIMFYGGRLLSHLSLERDSSELSMDELIKLLRINQHAAILLDSDRKKKNDEINETKSRIVKECAESTILCWVTAGREIENYLTPESISLAYEKITSKSGSIKFGAFDKIETAVQKAYQSGWRSTYSYATDKPAFARVICAEIEQIPERMDLKKKLAELIHSIRAAK
jgi:hypothetical protein